MTPNLDTSVRLSDYTPPAYRATRVEMHVELHPTDTRVTATTWYARADASVAATVPLLLDGDELVLDTIALDGKPLPSSAYAATTDGLTLLAPPQQPFSLTITTRVNPSTNTKLMGLYLSNGVYCTQCEADGFRRISYALDRPDVMATYRVRLEAAKADAPVLLSNGNPVEQGDLPGGRHFAVWDDPHPKPCYLFAMVGGDLGSIHDTFTTSDGREVALGIYVERGKEAQSGYAMQALKASMRWDETAFDRVYDLDVFNIVAVSDFNMGAMENKGLNIFNDKYVLASAENATDTDFAQIEAIIAHEYFHNWTGNRITCRDWFQLCLKEGLTVYRDQEFSSDMRSRAVKRIMDARELKSRQFVEDAGPLAHPVRPGTYREINNLYTATVYEKGAEVIRMLRLIIGKDAFTRGMNLYFERHDGDAATIEQFIACFAETSGMSLDHFMRWYDQAGTPTVRVKRRYDTAKRELTLHLTQATPPTPGQPDKQPQVIPLAYGVIGSKESNPRHAGVFVLETASAELVLQNVDADAVPSLCRGFSAPINLQLDLTEAEQLVLARSDSDPFNRWQAMQGLAIDTLKAATNDIRAGRSLAGRSPLPHVVEHIIRSGRDDPAFATLLITLPSELDMAREIGKDVDPDAIFAARSHLRKQIGLHVLQTAVDLYRDLADRGPYEPNAAGAGRRSLRNMLLDLIVLGNPDIGVPLANRQYADASNMTDRFAALAVLVVSSAPGNDAALADFDRRYRDNPLVMDKWFALQAAVADPATLARVKTLMDHPAFNLANPNRARALLGGFAMSNPTQFNRIDGKGYAFVADMILALDARNPQVAARIMTAFRSWRGLEPGRRAMAKETLVRIASEHTLSRDLRDIVDRTLA